MASQFSQSLLGFHLEGIWHSGIVCFDREFFFGGGIFNDLPGSTPYGRPLKKLILGTTTKTRAEFDTFLEGIRPRFRMQDYNLLEHNCNNFTNECSIFLTGAGIPTDIVDLPRRALSTPLGATLRPMIEQYQNQVTQQYVGVDSQISQAPAAAAPQSAPQLFAGASPIWYKKGDASKAISRCKQLAGTSLSPQDSAVLDEIAALSLATLDSSAKIPESFLGTLLRVHDQLQPQDRYPVLDIIRGLVAVPSQVANIMSSGVVQSSVDAYLGDSPTSDQVKIVSLRFTANLLCTEQGALLLMRHPLVAQLIDIGFQGIRVAKQRLAASILLYNLTLRAPKNSSDETVQLVSGLAHLLQHESDGLSGHPLLSCMLALGNLCFGNPSSIALVNALEFDVAPFLGNADQNTAMTARELSKLLSQFS